MTYYSEVKTDALSKLKEWFDKNIGTDYEIEQDDTHATFTSFDLTVKEANRLDEFLNKNNMYYDDEDDHDLDYGDCNAMERIKKNPIVYS
ncbi:MAG: hypothetical protein WC136_01940 [Sphaerochaeta sp.]|jgi:hypothetical protein